MNCNVCGATNIVRRCSCNPHATQRDIERNGKMSNTVDMVIVTGPAVGKVYNTPRPVAPLLEININNTVAMYKPQPWTDPYSGKKYWIAVGQGDAKPADTAITTLVLVAELAPAWDLNP